MQLTWFFGKKVLCLEAENVRDGGEDVRDMRNSTFYAIPLIDVPVPCFLVQVKLFEGCEEWAEVTRGEWVGLKMGRC